MLKIIGAKVIFSKITQSYLNFEIFRPMVKNVHKFEELKPRFKSKPSGLTPITAILSKVLKNNMPSHLYDKKLLTIIVTDGEPTNTEGKLFLLM